MTNIEESIQEIENEIKEMSSTIRNFVAKYSGQLNVWEPPRVSIGQLYGSLSWLNGDDIVVIEFHRIENGIEIEMYFDLNRDFGQSPFDPAVFEEKMHILYKIPYIESYAD